MPRREEAPAATIVPKRDDSHKMKVVEWHGASQSLDCSLLCRHWCA